MQFSIGAFEGPLDLLLTLVRREEMDIMNIDICRITSQYLNILRDSPAANLNEGGEFIRMASALLLIKSRSLLPQLEEEEEFQEDKAEPEMSKEDLITALKRRSQFLQAAEELNKRLLLNRDIWSCPGLSFSSKKNDEIEGGSLFALLRACRRALKKAHQYQMKIVMPSVSQWIQRIRKYFVRGKVLSFSSLVQKDKNELISHQILLSFLSLLELCKMGFVSLSQKGREIQILTKKPVGGSDFHIFEKQTNTRASSTKQGNEI